jgi:hypothetical protein
MKIFNFFLNRKIKKIKSNKQDLFKILKIKYTNFKNRLIFMD